MGNEIKVPTNDGGEMEIEELYEIREEVQSGRPRRWVEAFLRIKTEGGDVVPFRFTANQEYAYGETFGRLKRYEDGMVVVWVKDRKATSTSLWMGVGTAFLCCVPGFDMLIIGALEDHADVAVKMADSFYGGIRDVEDGSGLWVIRPPQSHWDKGYKEVGYGPLKGGGYQMTSSMTISTSRSGTFGRSRTPKMLLLTEKAHFSEEHEEPLMVSLKESLPAGGWRIDESTPWGTRSRFYADAQDIKAGRRRGIYLFRPWFTNPANVLARDNFHVVDGDRGPLVVDQEEGQLLVGFPEDGIGWEDRIRWRRWKVREAIAESMGDVQRGKGVFLQEHCENDIDCWMDLANPVFDVSMLRRMVDGASSPLGQDKLMEVGLSPVPYPGLALRAWRLPWAGARYVGGMDLSDTPGAGDQSVLWVKDLGSGAYVLRMAGRIRAVEALLQAAKVMKVYNDGILAPESTGLGGPAIDALRREGYGRIYFEAQSRPQSGPIKYGWKTDGASKKRMFSIFADSLASGSLTIPDRETIGAIGGFDPNREDHWPDDLMALMIAEAVSQEAYRFRFPGALSQPRPGMPQGSDERRVEDNAVVVHALPSGRVAII